MRRNSFNIPTKSHTMRHLSRVLCLAMILAAAALTGCGCSQTSATPDATQPTLADNACIIADTTFLNIGEVGYADILSLGSRLSNRGSKTVNIATVDTDCSCITAVPEREDIAPGESVKLNIEFDTRGNFGRQYHLIDIKTDNGQNIKICIFADIADPN